MDENNDDHKNSKITFKHVRKLRSCEAPAWDELVSGNSKRVVIFRSMHSSSLSCCGKKQVFHFVSDHCLCWGFFQWFEQQSLERSFFDWCNPFCISMLTNTSLLLSSSNTTTTSPISSLTEVTPGAVDEQIFFQTAAARGISGIFVWLSLIITCHQVRNSSNFERKCYLQGTRNETVHWREQSSVFVRWFCQFLVSLNIVINFLKSIYLRPTSFSFYYSENQTPNSSCINVHVQIWRGHDLLLFSCPFSSLGVTLSYSAMFGRLVKSILMPDFVVFYQTLLGFI